MKELKLEVGDFFHVEVVESEIDDEVELEVKDGPMKGESIFLDSRSNPGLEKDEDDEGWDEEDKGWGESEEEDEKEELD
jgi:hypothetical protein